MPKGKVVIDISDWRALQDALMMSPEAPIADVIAKAKWMRTILYTPLNRAALDLLAACEAVAEANRTGFECGVHSTEYRSKLQDAISKARKAVKRARATT